ncbi:MAG TPA: hypothetical protein VKZ18_14995 [Polyangia bacterium]|nr:hypothetical protein [Polyangia bacterium]
MRCWRSVARHGLLRGLLGLLCLVGPQLLACDQTPPVDQNFDSSLGADFQAPPTDAGTPDAPVPDGDAPSS